MQRPQVTGGTPLQIPPQPVPKNRHPILLYSIQPLLRETVISKEGHPHPQPDSPQTCGTQGAGQSCWSLDVRVAVLLVIVAGALILILLYRLLQLRHRLRLAQARHALEYYSFYHTATYTLKDPRLPRILPTNGDAIEVTPVANPVAPIVVTPVPPPPVSPPPTLPLPPPPILSLPPRLPPPPLLPPPLLPLSSSLSLPLPLPIIHTTPPSPHQSWGASSDAEVYSRIGAFRPSRLSSLSHSQVILFEHSSL
ncbi:sine oculis-binding protein homolog [Oncorhynchus mykiss]|uniref:sine oculis-binding protein homolog n=1 Tax=Oncorhynchus mykiss TaxID=8022 RepID=UPI000B4F600E|nr:sine oculis-binding protein homolog [Oncorhynchus mykiss]